MDNRLVGVYLPPRVFRYLTLFTLAKGMTKSKLLILLIEDWMRNVNVNGKESNLIQEIVIRANREWKEKKKAHPRASHNEFKTKLETELLDKGLPQKQVDTILTQIQDGKN